MGIDLGEAPTHLSRPDARRAFVNGHDLGDGTFPPHLGSLSDEIEIPRAAERPRPLSRVKSSSKSAQRRERLEICFAK